MRLFPTTPFIPAETPASFASRLAIVNSVTLSSFCRDFQLGQVELTRGTTQSLERLSELTGVDPGMLMQATWRAEHPFAHFRGHAFGTKDRDAEGSRACIQCLLDDHAADPSGACICFRGEWRISCLHTCEVHNAPIVTLPKTARQLRWDFVARVLAQRNGLIVPSLRRAPSGLETYVRSRVNGVSQEPNWLDALPVRAAVASCNAIGATAVFGGEHNRDLLTDDHWWEAGGKGFEIISGGADAIAAFLRDHQVPTHGSLHLWLCSAKASDPVYDPFRDILTHHFVDTVAFHRNARMFGKPLPAREIHSVVTAAEEFGIFPKFIRRIVLARLPEAEVEQEKADGELTFKAADFADEFRRLASALLVRDLPNYAGCKPMTAQTLVRKGFIKPILTPNGDRLGILRFAREDVDAFLGRLSACAEIVQEAPQGALPIAISPANVPCTVDVVINLILNEELSWLRRIEGVHGFDGLLIDASEVRKKAFGPAPGNLTFHQAFHMMGVGGGAFHRLVRAGLIELLPITQPGNRPATPHITFEEVIRFRNKYASLSDASKQLSMNPRHIKSALDAAGIHALDLGLVPSGCTSASISRAYFRPSWRTSGGPKSSHGRRVPGRGSEPRCQTTASLPLSARGIWRSRRPENRVRVSPRVRMRRGATRHPPPPPMSLRRSI